MSQGKWKKLPEERIGKSEKGYVGKDGKWHRKPVGNRCARGNSKICPITFRPLEYVQPIPLKEMSWESKVRVLFNSGRSRRIAPFGQ